MKTRLIILISLLSACRLLAGDPPAALTSLPAPPEEFVKMPAKYVIEKLEKTARKSGDPALGGFKIDVLKPGADNERIDINMEGMTLAQAVQAVAAALGAELDYEQGIAKLRDPSQIISSGTEVVAEVPEIDERDDNEKIAFEDVGSALVFVETGVGRASAFIAAQGEKTYLFSNQHNFMGANKLELRAMNGALLEFKTFEFSRTRDLVRFELDPAQLHGIGVLGLADQSPTIGQSIVVYGNSAGGNVATELKGKVLGVGPSDIEVDADIVPGNSGSPILAQDGGVLGVATYITFELKFAKNDRRKQSYKGTRFDDARRYGVRIPADGWVEVNMRNFLNQTYRLADAKNYLEIMHILVQYWNGDDDYEDAAKLIMTSYSTSGNRAHQPYKFHFSENEDEISMMVKAFKRNFDEFVDRLADMDLSKGEMSKLRKSYGKKSTSKVEMLDYHIRTSLLEKARRVQDDLKQYNWMSDFLRESAAPLDALAGELIRLLEASENPYTRVKEHS
jgi:hypothetical protein